LRSIKEGETREANGHLLLAGVSPWALDVELPRAALVFFHLPWTATTSSSRVSNASFFHLPKAVLGSGSLLAAVIDGGASGQPPRYRARWPPPRDGARRRSLAVESHRQCSALASRAPLPMRGHGIRWGLCVWSGKLWVGGKMQGKCGTGLLPFL
jgi:hypothetical protein